MAIDYKVAGVDITAGNEAVNEISPLVKKTFNDNVLTGLGGFGSLFDLKTLVQDYQNPVLVQSIDGVGTKSMVAVKAGAFKNLGRDLFSAACNDIVVMGAKPITFLDYLAFDTLKPHIVKELIEGMSEACCESGVALVGGEMAEMPGVYQAQEIDVVGVITGIVEKDKIINGQRIQEGDELWALSSSGLHTNGYSLVRKLCFEVGQMDLKKKYSSLNDETLGEVLLRPHINYTNVVSDVLRAGVDIRGMAHITGGGLIENIPRILPEGLGAKIQKK